jgi:hypothetical protein
MFVNIYLYFYLLLVIYKGTNESTSISARFSILKEHHKYEGFA